jgi:hypothetical protein
VASDYDDERYVSPTSIADVVEQDDGTHEIRIRIEPPSSEEIADALARRLFSDYSNSNAIRETALAAFENMVVGAVNAEAKAAIAEAMGVARQPTDAFGNPVGVARTFSQMIGEQVRAWQEETVNAHDGKPAKPDAYNRDRVITRREYLVRQVGAAEFEKLAKEEVAKVRAIAKAKVEATIKDTVAKSLSALVSA